VIRTLIVDDEAPARAKIRKLLAAEDDVEIVGEAGSGVEAVAAIRRENPDLVFLDIRMPQLDGFGVIEEIGVEEMPLVVFVTAYDEHALKAFEVHALDYLLKPFAGNRLGRLLDRVRRQLERESSAQLARRMQQMLDAVCATPRYLHRIMAHKDEERELLLPVERIDLIRAHGNHVRLHTADGVYERRITLTELDGRLDPEKFLRLNRSEIVRLDAIREIQPWFHGDYHVILRNGEKLSWSRRYRAKIKGEF